MRELIIEIAHFFSVIKNQYYEQIDWPLLGYPKTQRVTAQTKLIKGVDEHNPAQKWHHKPNNQKFYNQTDIGLPIGVSIIVHRQFPLQYDIWIKYNNA